MFYPGVGKHIQHLGQILQQGSWIPAFNNDGEGADVDDVVFANYLVGDVGEHIHGV